MAEPVLGGILPQSRCARATAEPALDVRTEPAATTAGAPPRKCARTHPAIDLTAVSTGDPLDIPGAEQLIDSGDTFGQGTVRFFMLGRGWLSRVTVFRCERQLKNCCLSTFMHRSPESWDASPGSFECPITYPIVPSRPGGSPLLRELSEFRREPFSVRQHRREMHVEVPYLPAQADLPLRLQLRSDGIPAGDHGLSGLE
jgi:hypothetical protein